MLFHSLKGLWNIKSFAVKYIIYSHLEEHFDCSYFGRALCSIGEFLELEESWGVAELSSPSSSSRHRALEKVTNFCVQGCPACWSQAELGNKYECLGRAPSWIPSLGNKLLTASYSPWRPLPSAQFLAHSRSSLRISDSVEITSTPPRCPLKFPR